MSLNDTQRWYCFTLHTLALVRGYELNSESFPEVLTSFSLAWYANESPIPALSSCSTFSFVDVESSEGGGPGLENER